MPNSPTAATKLPAPLLPGEKKWAVALVAIGAIFLVGTVVWFAGSTGGSLKTKETKTTQASGATPERTTATEYSDTVLLAGLGIGSALLLTGAFYGRIREIALPGGVKIGLGDLPAAQKEIVEDAIRQKAGEVGTTPEEVGAITAVALQKANDGIAHHQGAAVDLSSASLKQVGSTAVDEAHAILPF